jgi:hypothetical protein
MAVSCDFQDFVRLLQGEVDIIFKLPDQKPRGFLVLIALKRMLPEYDYKVFGKMTVRI